MATLTCLFAFHLAVRKGISCESHSHPCPELVIYRGAAGTLTQGGTRHSYQDGSIAVYQPGLQHFDECTRPGTHLCLGITGCGAEHLPPGMYRTNANMRTAAGHILRQLRHNDSLHRAKVECLSGWIITELQLALSAPSARKAPPTSTHVRSAKTILDARFSEPISIGSVARELFIHPDYLRQLFRQQLGESPLHYLLRKRMDHACELLRGTGLNVKEIAARSGLENPYYFSRLFRKLIGQSPSEYRMHGPLV